ncbi:TPA: hypothetical protein ENS27_10390 [bacterium]|nr:hypothetical protein [bacterium]
MKRIIYSLISLIAITLILSGCAVLKEPTWTKLEVTSEVEQFTDGSMYTTAEAQMPEYIKGEARDDSRFRDAVVSLKSVQPVKRVLIKRRTEDTVVVDIDLYAMINSEWQIVKELRGIETTDIDIKINTTNTDKIKIRVQRATRTASGKSAVVSQPQAGGAGGGRKVGNDPGAAERILREPVKFAEIEVYGISEEPIAQKTGK